MTEEIAVEEDSKSLSRQLDRCERELDRLDRELVEKIEQDETIPEDILGLQAAGRERVGRLRERIEEIALMERMRKRLARREKDRNAEIVEANPTALLMGKNGTERLRHRR